MRGEEVAMDDPSKLPLLADLAARTDISQTVEWVRGVSRRAEMILPC